MPILQVSCSGPQYYQKVLDGIIRMRFNTHCLGDSSYYFCHSTVRSYSSWLGVEGGSIQYFPARQVALTKQAISSQWNGNSRIWTWLTKFIFYDNNHYVKSSSSETQVAESVDFFSQISKKPSNLLSAL